ncbi:MAG: hypothetical protein IK149_09125 [Oscillospiraceae bacterium]|nr:hypothetical protein [Oscillospiraceae bacterium]
MKRIIALIVLIAMLALTACGQAKPAAPSEPEAPAASAEEAPKSEETPQDEVVGMPNPWREVTEDEARTLCPGALRAPDGAENVCWSVMETEGAPALVQLSFDLDGMSYTAREQATNDKDADISGMFYTWTAQTGMTLQNWTESAKSGACFRYVGEDEWADLCTWYDAASGISYSLSVTAKDLDGFDLQAIAEALCVPATPAAESGREDGERFEAVIILEGMEETVQYEHLRRETLGFEMDYDYESFVRQSDADRERFVSVWDDPQNPENYLDLSFVAEDADAAAEAVRAELSAEYELLESTRELAGAGESIYIEASVIKGTNNMADQLQAVYIIPAGEGCIVARAHYAAEAAEGFGRRFNYLLNTLTLIER